MIREQIMKTLFLSLFILAPMACLTSCTVVETNYVPAYTNTGYVTTVSTYSAAPTWGYVGYGYGYDTNWYGGGQDYYSSSVYVDSW